MKKAKELKCPFCHEGKKREDNCGCLTCRKCHRVEGELTFVDEKNYVAIFKLHSEQGMGMMGMNP